jgi:hypothetical protein
MRMPSLLLLLLPAARALSVGILGAQGHLGRELVAQGLARGWTVHAYVRRPCDPIRAPARRGWLSPDGDDAASPPLASARLHVHGDVADVGAHGLDALVSAMSGRPFADEAGTTAALRGAGDALDPARTRVCLVSAHGVGGGDADAGIRAMRGWYLRGVYEAKAEQEAYVRARWAADGGRRALVLRPRVLSFGAVPLNPVARTRRSLAREICEWAEA